MNTNTSVNTFIAIQPHPGIIVSPNKGSHPPQNNNTIKEHISKMLAYSAKKNNTNPTAEYSTWYPATSSDSASGRSKGTLFVSANPEITNNRNEGNKGIINTTLFCANTIAEILVDPTTINTGIITSAILIS